MGSASLVANVCAGLHETAFELRQAVPLTWYGDAAEEFEAQIEQAVSRLAGIVQDLDRAARLVQLHELHIAVLRGSMSGAG